MGILSVTKIHDGLWQFNEKLGENHGVDAYLLTGEKRALLVDALQDVEGVYPEIRKITALPLDVLVEHGHGDHTGPAMREIKDAGGKVYLHPDDLPLLLDDKERHFTRDFFTPIQDGEKLDLGGTVLDIILVSGHTPGSLVALDRKRHWLLSSDTIGSGPFWVQLPHSLALHRVRDNLKALYNELKQYPDLLIYAGHRYQSPNQLGLGYLADTIETLELILDGKLTGTPVEAPAWAAANPWLSVKHKSSLGLVYNPEKL
jgi:glyoxylase-like metal-dependent hydrolase (beta-lactamase superfamily II)